jgi:hypothetical protein
MLVMPVADTRSVIHRVLAFASLVCCGFVLVSFLLFARDQTASASKHQASELIVAATSTGSPVRKAQAKKQPRRFIDGVASTLTSPFDAVVHSSNPWVDHGIPTVLSVVVYGLGLSFLARVARPSL